MILYPKVWGALVLSKCVINYKLGYARKSWRYTRAYFENSPKKQNTPVTITSVSRILTFTSWPLTVKVWDNLSRAIKDTTLAVIIKNMWTSDHQNSIFLHGRALINSLHPQPKIRIDTKLVQRLKYINCEYIWIWIPLAWLYLRPNSCKENKLKEFNFSVNIPIAVGKMLSNNTCCYNTTYYNA